MLQDVAVWIFFCMLGSFNVVGLVEGVKSFFEALRNKSGMMWAPPVSLVLSFAMSYALSRSTVMLDALGSGITAIIFGGATIFSIGELLGYNVVAKWLFAIIDSGVQSIRSRSSGNTGAEEEKTEPHSLDEAPRGTPCA